MKKIFGFTIVELSIVLVVIGIILGMGVKGQDLIRIANLRNEVIAVNRLQAAVIGYNVESEIPYDNVSQTYDTSVLIQKGFITAKDMESVLENSTRVLKSCQPNNAGKYVWSNAPLSICLANMYSGAMTTSGEVICSLEKSLDDRTLTAGRGRLLSTSARADNYTLDEYERCNTVANRELYAFRLVQFK